MRPSWDNYFMEIASIVATRSTCDRAQVGCVLVRDKAILSTGYNGAPSGLEHCDDAGHLMEDGHCVRTVHSEANAILWAAKLGTAIAGSTLYCTHRPCLNCLKLIVMAGVRRIVYKQDYGSMSMFEAKVASQAGVPVEKLT